RRSIRGEVPVQRRSVAANPRRVRTSSPCSPGRSGARWRRTWPAPLVAWRRLWAATLRLLLRRPRWPADRTALVVCAAFGWSRWLEPVPVAVAYGLELGVA